MKITWEIPKLVNLSERVSIGSSENPCEPGSTALFGDCYPGGTAGFDCVENGSNAYSTCISVGSIFD